MSDHLNRGLVFARVKCLKSLLGVKLYHTYFRMYFSLAAIGT